MARRCRLEGGDRCFVIRARPVLDAARHRTVLGGTETDHAVAKLHSHFATPHQEHFVFVVVAVPRELASKLHELHLLSIWFSNDLGRQCSVMNENFSSMETATTTSS